MKFSVILIGAILLVSAIVAIEYLQFRAGPGSVQRLFPEGLQDADLVFRRGRSVESFAVCLAGDDHDFSHVGLVVIRGGSPFIVHAVPGESGKDPGYIRMEKPSEFLKHDKASRFAVYRSAFGSEVMKRVAAEAYGFYLQRCQFDHGYDLDSDDRLYCTELIIKAFRNAGLLLEGLSPTVVDLVFIKKEMILPDALMKNGSFRIITHN